MASRTGRPPKFTPAQIVAALESSAGIISVAARILRCDPTTVRRYISSNHEVSTALDDIVEERLDVAEASLLRLMTDASNPNAQLNACIFYLRTKGKARGYTTVTEVTGKGGGPIESKATVTLDLSNCTQEEIEELEAAALLGVKAVSPNRH
jgi:hypothetical protein